MLNEVLSSTNGIFYEAKNPAVRLGWPDRLFLFLLLQGALEWFFEERVRKKDGAESLASSFFCIASTLRTDLDMWFMELKWIEITCQLICTPHLIKDPEEQASWQLHSIFYLKVVCHNHKSEVCQRNNFVIHLSNTVFPGMKRFLFT